MPIWYEWVNAIPMGARTYTCGYCGVTVGPSQGYRGTVHGVGDTGIILLCPNCSQPTFISLEKRQVPAPRLGADVTGVTDLGVLALYEAARRCTAADAFTAAVLICRKILMNLAVAKGAQSGLKFAEYVTFLEAKGWVPPDGHPWVDAIRTTGNEATHEIALKEKADAERLLGFVEMLLRFMFEFPGKVAAAPSATQARSGA